MHEKGIALWLIGMGPSAYAIVIHAPLGQAFGRAGMFLNLELAVARYQMQVKEE